MRPGGQLGVGATKPLVIYAIGDREQPLPWNPIVLEPPLRLAAYVKAEAPPEQRPQGDLLGGRLKHASGVHQGLLLSKHDRHAPESHGRRREHVDDEVVSVQPEDLVPPLDESAHDVGIPERPGAREVLIVGSSTQELRVVAIEYVPVKNHRPPIARYRPCDAKSTVKSSRGSDASRR